mmetsp:Transcript_19996/g.55638  ORF Transcript_19996/g.55638 Transcript_19996/m.55638 type:complete len:229 (-) Transcript_19996:235-921(-)
MTTDPFCVSCHSNYAPRRWWWTASTTTTTRISPACTMPRRMVEMVVAWYGAIMLHTSREERGWPKLTWPWTSFCSEECDSVFPLIIVGCIYACMDQSFEYHTPQKHACMCPHALPIGQSLPPLGWSAACGAGLFGPSRLGTCLGRRLGLAGPWQLGAQLAFEFGDDLRVGNGLSRLVHAHDLRLFVDGRRQILLRHFLSHARLHDGLRQGLVDLGDLAYVIGLLQLAG